MVKKKTIKWFRQNDGALFATKELGITTEIQFDGERGLYEWRVSYYGSYIEGGYCHSETEGKRCCRRFIKKLSLALQEWI